MRILGISEGFHDAGVCLIEDQKILYASHSERYSRIKNDRNVHPKQYKKSHKIAFYEKPWLKHTRRFLCGQSFKPCTTNYDISFYIYCNIQCPDESLSNPHHKCCRIIVWAHDVRAAS